MNKENFYWSLQAKLTENETWPLLYMFKFIVPSDNEKIAAVVSLFTENAQISIKQSRKGTYTSITAKEIMINPEEVIQKYQQVEHIEGLIAL